MILFRILGPRFTKFRRIADCTAADCSVCNIRRTTYAIAGRFIVISWRAVYARLLLRHSSARFDCYTHTCFCTYALIHTHTHTHTHTHPCSCTYALTHTHIHTHSHTHTCSCTYALTHIHRHTHTHTYTVLWPDSKYPPVFVCAKLLQADYEGFTYV